MNYDTLLSAAHDYIYAYTNVRRTFPHGFTLWDSTLLHSEAAQKSICHDRCGQPFFATGAFRRKNRLMEKGQQHTVISRFR